MMRTPVLLTTLALLLLTPGAYAQPSPEEEVRAAIETLFDGMRAGDSTAVRSVFDASAQIASTGFRNGAPVMGLFPAGRFVNAVGTPHEEIWDERIWDLQIHVRDNLASAWMKFAFFAGDTFSHCGVNSFQLFRSDGGWKIIFLADTRQTENCEMPPGD